MSDKPQSIRVADLSDEDVAAIKAARHSSGQEIAGSARLSWVEWNPYTVIEARLCNGDVTSGAAFQLNLTGEKKPTTIVALRLVTIPDATPPILAGEVGELVELLRAMKARCGLIYADGAIIDNAADLLERYAAALESICRETGKGPGGLIDWQRCVDRIQERARAALQAGD